MLKHKNDVFRQDTSRKISPSAKSVRVVLLICLLLAIFFVYQIKIVHGRTIQVPTEYATIQEAIDNATAGDTIQVAAGTYYEHVVVSKSLTIIGENPQSTIVDGTMNGTVFDIDVSNVYITGFTIRNAGSGHSGIAASNDLPRDDNHQIVNNIITSCGYGVYLSLSGNNIVFNNTFTDNAFGGVFLNDAHYSNIASNTIVHSTYGIKAVSSLNIIIESNTVSQTSYAVHLSLASTGGIIRRNILSARTIGVYSSSDGTTVDHNTISESAYAIYFYSCYDGSIYYNSLTDCSYGIRLYMQTSSASSHNINNNKVWHNDWALELVYADSNTFTGNWIQQNTYGVYMSSSGSNMFYHNNFISNSMQVYSGIGAGNQWDYNGEGNYWSDYTGEDQNDDGIGDSEYRITPLGRDYYPLMNTWSEHDISIENLTLSTTETYRGLVVNITVTVKNNGKIEPPMSETFNVTVGHALNTIETKQVVNLAQEATAILTFTWDTAEVSPGNYAISAEASIILDELNADNNLFTDGTVRIKMPGDINGDGIVNYDDFIIFSAAYGTITGQPAYDERADFDGDGDVDYDDFLIMAGNYGKTE